MSTMSSCRESGTAYGRRPTVPQTSLMGAFLAEMVHGREHPSAPALQRRGWSWPPEPLRWATCQLLTAGLRVD